MTPRSEKAYSRISHEFDVLFQALQADVEADKALSLPRSQVLQSCACVAKLLPWDLCKGHQAEGPRLLAHVQCGLFMMASTFCSFKVASACSHLTV